MNPNQLNELVAKAQRGDGNAFDHMRKEYYRIVYSLASGISKKRRSNGERQSLTDKSRDQVLLRAWNRVL